MVFMTLLCFSSEISAQDVSLWPEHVGLNSWFNEIPVEASQHIVNIGFTGRYANYTDADTWYPTWASDGNLYSPWTDGTIGDEECISYTREKAHTGQAKIIGDNPKKLNKIVVKSIDFKYRFVVL